MQTQEISPQSYSCRTHRSVVSQFVYKQKLGHKRSVVKPRQQTYKKDQIQIIKHPYMLSSVDDMMSIKGWHLFDM